MVSRPATSGLSRRCAGRGDEANGGIPHTESLVERVPGSDPLPRCVDDLGAEVVGDAVARQRFETAERLLDLGLGHFWVVLRGELANRADRDDMPAELGAHRRRDVAAPGSSPPSLNSET